MTSLPLRCLQPRQLHSPHPWPGSLVVPPPLLGRCSLAPPLVEDTRVHRPGIGQPGLPPQERLAAAPTAPAVISEANAEMAARLVVAVVAVVVSVVSVVPEARVVLVAPVALADRAALAGFAAVALVTLVTAAPVAVIAVTVAAGLGQLLAPVPNQGHSVEGGRSAPEEALVSGEPAAWAPAVPLFPPSIHRFGPPAQSRPSTVGVCHRPLPSFACRSGRSFALRYQTPLMLVRPCHYTA